MRSGSRGLGAAIIALAAASGAMQRAQAAELGFYVAGFYGEAKFDGVEKAQFDDYATLVYSVYGFTPEQTVSTLGDDTDASFGMAAGYRLFPNLALEGGYVDLGELSYRNDSFGTHIDHQEPWFQKLSASTSGIALSALGVLPLSYRWELYARGGVLFATNEVDIYITDFFGEDALTVSESSTELLAGVGASISFAEVYSARFEYQRVFDAGDGPFESDLDIMSIGFTVSF
jgi:opacity protein-like surface antigen